MGVLSRLQMPSFDALDHLVRTHTALSAGLLFAMTVLIVTILWWRRRYLSGGQQVLLGLLLASCVVQQFNLAFLLLTIFAYSHREGLLAFRKLSVLAIIGFVAVSFVLWFLYTYHALEPSKLAIAAGSSHTRQALKTLLDYPKFRLVWGYVLQRPLLSIPVAFGLLACFHTTSREKSDQKALFLMLMFAGPLLINGFVKTHYQAFRYGIHVDIFYLTLAGLGAVTAPIVLKQICFGRDPHLTLPDQGAPRFQRNHWVTIVPALCLVALLDLNPVNAWWLSARGEYHLEQRWHRYFPPVSYPDFKTTAQYVRDRMHSDDLVVAVYTTREYYNYLGRLDYWVGTGHFDGQTYREGQVAKDLYVAVPQITDVDQLKEVLEGNDGKRKWLLAASKSLHPPGNKNLTPQIVDYILALQDKVVYIGKDQNHKVYLIE
jgi:hypothetical protein